MKKDNEKLNEKANDRITIYNIGKGIKFYYYNFSKREISICFYEIPFSLSVKKRFGCNGQTIRELYDFKSWNNKKLSTVVMTMFRELEQSLSKSKTIVVKQEVLCYER